MLGPLAALGLCLLFIGLFYTGKILSRTVVPREDYEAQKEVIASQAKGLEHVTAALNDLVVAVRTIQKNGGVG